jgi:hypothetical protein
VEEIQSLDENELYERLMRSASFVWQCEAAVRLVFKTTALRQWLIERRFVVSGVLNGLPIAEIMFAEACAHIRSLSASAGRREAEGPERSEANVLWVAASLWGEDVGSLGYAVEELDAGHAQRVAEAVMYAAGYMDGKADPLAGDAEGPGTGPNAVAHEKRAWWEDPLEREAERSVTRNLRRLAGHGDHWELAWSGYPFPDDLATALTHPTAGLAGASQHRSRHGWTIHYNGAFLTLRSLE